MKKQDIVVYALADALVKNPEKVRAFENVINRTIALTSGDGIEIIWTGYYSQSKIEVKGARSGMYIVINVGGRKERKKQEEKKVYYRYDACNICRLDVMKAVKEIQNIN